MKNINGLSSRGAMHLPETYVPSPFDTFSEQTIAQNLCESDISKLDAHRTSLSRLVENPAQTVASRLMAGSLLALVGDPRIDVLKPAMVDVPASVVSRGTPFDQVDSICARYAHLGVKRNWVEKECPRHNVSLSSFRIGKYPVTQGEYRAFLIANPERHPPSSWPFGVFPHASSNHPVHGITAGDADAYCQWLASATGRAFRLPTEAEWEYAAAGQEGRQFPWGDFFDSACANTLETGIQRTTPVGAFPAGASPFGALDMAGNVEEFVSCHYHLYPGGTADPDDLEELFGNYRVARGGSFTRNEDLARCQRRHGWFPKDIYVMGFRIAESLEHPMGLERSFKSTYENSGDTWTTEPALRRPVETFLATNDVRGAKILDLGCGSGADLAAFLKAGCGSASGVDLVAHHNWDQFQAAHQNLSFQTADVLSLPFRPSTFDVIIDSGCFHHQEQDRRVTYLACVSSWLKVGGTFLLTVYHADSDSTRAGNSGKDHHAFTVRSITALAESAGFELRSFDLVERSGFFQHYIACTFIKRASRGQQ